MCIRDRAQGRAASALRSEVLRVRASRSISDMIVLQSPDHCPTGQSPDFRGGFESSRTGIQNAPAWGSYAFLRRGTQISDQMQPSAIAKSPVRFKQIALDGIAPTAPHVSKTWCNVVGAYLQQRTV